MTTATAARWADTTNGDPTVASVCHDVWNSPDRLLHARRPDVEVTLCEEAGDRALTGPATYVSKTIGVPDPLGLHVTCPDCRAWMHA